MKGGRGLRGWRETFTVAADLALVGFVVTLAALPIVTAGAAVRAGSVAVHAIAVDATKVDIRQLWRVFRRSLLPGLGATVALAAALGFLAFDFAAVRGERVPGGRLLLILLAVAGLAVLGIAGAAVAELGRDPDARWSTGVRRALSRPNSAAGCGAVLGIALAIAVLVPFTAPIVAGYALFAVHAIAARAHRVAPIPESIKEVHAEAVSELRGIPGV